MDFQDLLDEVEGAIRGTPATKQPRQTPASLPSREVSTNVNASNSRRKTELDDLLDMMSDEEGSSSTPAAVHPRMTLQSEHKRASNEFHAGGTKKCSQMLLAGEPSKRGQNSAFSSSTVCSNLRCNECDFTVVQFPGKKWSASADYMFFRENVPNEAKLRRKMEDAADTAAYACQCKWLSIDAPTRLDTCRVKWSCAGH